MQSFIALLAFALSAVAFQVTAPSNTSSWTSTGTNTLSWNTVDTDASTFAVVLTNLDRSILPTNDMPLASSVDGSQGSVQISAPSGGLPVGTGFRVNLIKSAGDIDSIYSQSDEFDIIASSSSSSSTSASSSGTSSSTSAGSTLTVPAPSGTSSGSTTGTSSSTSPSGSNTALNPTSNGAMALNAKTGIIGVGLILGALFA